MLSWFKKRNPIPKALAFKPRVAAFWKWYEENAARFYQTIEAKRCPDLSDEVSAKVDELFPGFAWNFSAGENKIGHAFTLSGEGNPHKQRLSAFWRERAPTIDGWAFHATKQPCPDVMDFVMQVGSQNFKPIEFWLTPRLNSEEEKIDITIWHPLFPKMDERDRWQVSFLFLDEAVGEIDTENWIGEIEIGDQRLAQAIPLGELVSFIAKTREETGWKKGGPGELWTGYRGNEPQGGLMRRDIVAGSTSQFALIAELEDGVLDPDPLAAWGADYVYVAFDGSFLPEGGEVDARGEIEDALSAALESEASGIILGGAMGLDHAYIDLLLFDGDTSLGIVQRVLRAKGLPAGTTIEYFAKAKQAQRIRL